MTTTTTTNHHLLPLSTPSITLNDLTIAIQDAGLVPSLSQHYAKLLMKELGITSKELLSQVSVEDLKDCGIHIPVHIKIILDALTTLGNHHHKNNNTYRYHGSTSYSSSRRLVRNYCLSSQKYLGLIFLLIIITSTWFILNINHIRFLIRRRDEILTPSSPSLSSTTIVQQLLSSSSPSQQSATSEPTTIPPPSEKTKTIIPTTAVAAPKATPLYGTFRQDIRNYSMLFPPMTYHSGKIKFSTHSFLPTMKAFGCSVRPKQMIPDVDWFIPDPEPKKIPQRDKLKLHPKHAAAALHVMPFSHLCPPGQGGWLWVEDDVTLCEGTKEHLAAIECVLRQLPLNHPLVYVRTSFGFNGIIIRCARHDEFVAAVEATARDHKIGLDFSVSFFFRRKRQDIEVERQQKNQPASVFNSSRSHTFVTTSPSPSPTSSSSPTTLDEFPATRVGVYAYQLFSHAGLKSEIWPGLHGGESVEHRQNSLPQCLDLNLNTHNPLEVYDMLCYSNNTLLSPCPSSMPWHEYSKQCYFPSVPDHRIPQNTSIAVVTSGGNFTCERTCRRHKKTCSREAIYDINRALASGTLIQFTDQHPPCRRIRTMTRTSVYNKNCKRPFRASEGYCYARLPAMDEPDPCGAFRTKYEARCFGDFICGCV
jgi:hypothetical protein